MNHSVPKPGQTNPVFLSCSDNLSQSLTRHRKRLKQQTTEQLQTTATAQELLSLSEYLTAIFASVPRLTQVTKTAESKPVGRRIAKTSELTFQLVPMVKI